MATSKIKSDSIDTIAATKLTGTVDNARITLDAAEIPNLDATKITTGSIAEARLATLDATKLTGNIANARVPASAVTQHAANEITTSSSDPLITTNPAGGVGTVWANTTSGEMYICTNATTNDNVWKNVGTGVGSISNFIVASGGTITTDGNFKIHTFTTSGTFTVSQTGAVGLTMKVLAVAGGGGGGGPVRAAGGGAGGLLYNQTISPTNGAQTVTIGAGGNSGPNVGTTNQAATGINGTNTVFQTLTSIGGGGGGAADGVRDGNAGGSGGGCWLVNGTPGAGTAGQGFVGGQGVNSHPYYGGGGGGAGQAGRSATDATRPEGGGNGLQIDITGTNTYYAGGGAAGNYNQNSNPPSVGGLGGGGTGKSAPGTTVGQAPSNGTANLGGGGGASGNGGSGVVIIRYEFQ